MKTRVMMMQVDDKTALGTWTCNQATGDGGAAVH